MTLKELRNLDKDDILEMLGLETKRSTGAWMAGTLGTFGVGLLVGAGIALMLAPKAGRELREDIRDKLRRAPSDIDESLGSVSSRESLTGGNQNKTY
jgi:gas vesicle protein